MKARMLAVLLAVLAVAAPAASQTEPVSVECRVAQAEVDYWNAGSAYDKADTEWKATRYRRHFVARQNAREKLVSALGERLNAWQEWWAEDRPAAGSSSLAEGKSGEPGKGNAERFLKNNDCGREVL